MISTGTHGKLSVAGRAQTELIMLMWDDLSVPLDEPEIARLNELMETVDEGRPCSRFLRALWLEGMQLPLDPALDRDRSRLITNMNPRNRRLTTPKRRNLGFGPGVASLVGGLVPVVFLGVLVGLVFTGRVRGEILTAIFATIALLVDADPLEASL